MDQVDSGHHLEKFTINMTGSSDAWRSEIDLARVRLGIGDELGDGFGRNRGINHHHFGHTHDTRDRRDVADKIVFEVVVERRVDRVRRGHQEKCVAVRWGTHDRFGADSGAATWAVFYYELLAEPPREPRSDEPRENVRQSAGGCGDDDAHRPRRIVLRPRDARHGRQRGSAGD